MTVSNVFNVEPLMSCVCYARYVLIVVHFYFDIGLLIHCHYNSNNFNTNSSTNHNIMICNTSE